MSKPQQVKRYASHQDYFIKITLSDAEDNTSETLNIGGMTDLPLIKTLLAIYQISMPAAQAAENQEDE